MRAGSWGRLILDLSRPGWLGVNLFFVLSGFLITGILFDSAGTAQSLPPLLCPARASILPAYYAVLIVLWLFGQASRAVFRVGPGVPRQCDQSLRRCAGLRAALSTCG